MARFQFLCIAGTGGRYHDWCHNPTSPFMVAMRRLGGEPLLDEHGNTYSWSGKLNGLFWTGEQEWHQEADVVERLLSRVPYEERIVFAHSHGGQIGIILGARGFPFRTFTTIATPYRPNLHPEDAAKHIGFWQHVYDPERDFIGTVKRQAERWGLGGIGGGATFGDRRFLIPGVINVGIPEARHSRVFVEKLDEMIKAGVLHRAYQLGL